MDIYEAGSRATRPANPAYFTGTVWQDPIQDAPEPARLSALLVHFAPGARTHWHTHPFGQTLFVVQGVGRVCCRGQAPRVIRANDTVWIPPGVEHWHGGGPESAMSHIAMQEKDGALAADWLEAVSEDDYMAQPQH